MSNETDAIGTEVLLARIEDLERQNRELRTVMVAAGEEIAAHWEAHCDNEGYGPANLVRRLETAVAVEYPAYSVGRWAELDTATAQAVSLAEYVESHAKGSMVEKVREFLSLPYAMDLRRRLQ